MVPELHTQLMMLISAKSPQKEMKSIWINQTKETRFFIFNTIFNDPKKKRKLIPKGYHNSGHRGLNWKIEVFGSSPCHNFTIFVRIEVSESDRSRFEN